ncbi:glycosyltransferase [Krasilnikoviella flava]|uniref:Glycosyltransferase involved in cell wall bisynthesis n=1 Tax=Krasilnikoviella flava TaxID=526729 RepID=A0A1T5IAZ9_9MICO|nr:glycosyltransferase [Krasilnikoviella flava]SKC36260.1 Glycosyltransferase involved in cell wall bisynthesis [Krasilnikoviella flava]
MIVAFGTYDASRHPRVGVLVAGLRAHGYTVRELDRPLGLSTAARVRMLRQPWRLPGLLVRLLRCWALLVGDVVRHRRAHGRPDAVLVGYLGHFDVVLARLLFGRTPVLLDHLVFAGDTAADRGARGVRVRLLRGLDRLAAACADVVLLDTPEHLRMLGELAPRRARRGLVVPVGAPAQWFDAAPAAVRDPARDGGPLRVVFFGLFTPLQGADVLADALAGALPRAAEDAEHGGRALAVTLVGSGQDLPAARERLRGTPGIAWRDWVEPADLPALVAAHDVCLGIFSATPKGLRVVPNKVFQGLAAGCVVVTSDTEPQRRLLGGHLELVPPADPGALADRLLALRDADALTAAHARAAAGRDLARPAAVVEPLVRLLDARGVRP